MAMPELPDRWVRRLDGILAWAAARRRDAARAWGGYWSDAYMHPEVERAMEEMEKEGLPRGQIDFWLIEKGLKIAFLPRYGPAPPDFDDPYSLPTLKERLAAARALHARERSHL